MIFHWLLAYDLHVFRYPSVGTMVLGDAGAADVQQGDYHTGACAFWEPGFFNYSWAGN